MSPTPSILKQAGHRVSPRLSRTLQTISLSLDACLLVMSGVLSKLMVDRYDGRVLPGVWIDELDAHEKTAAELQIFLDQKERQLAGRSIVVAVDGQEYVLSARELGLTMDSTTVIDQALSTGREHFIRDGFWRILLGGGSTVKLTTHPTFTGENIRTVVSATKQRFDKPGTEPTARLKYTGSPASLTIEKGTQGYEVDDAQALIQLQHIAGDPNQVIRVEIQKKIVGKQLSDTELVAAKERATKLVGKQLTLKTPDRSYTTNDQKMVSLLAFPTGLSPEQLAAYTSELEKHISRPTQQAVFEYDEKTLHVKTFTPPHEMASNSRPKSFLIC